MRKDSKLLRASFTFNGKRYEVYAATKKELNEKIIDKKAALKRGEVVIESTMRLTDWANMCVDTYKTNIGDETLRNYKYTLNKHILDEIGNKRIKDVKAITCQEVMNKCEGMSKRTINEVYQMLNFIFQKAVDNDLINKNPAKNITRPAGTKEERRSLTKKEEAFFLSAVKQHPHGLYFMLMYGCGCRPTEAANIEGRDISYVNGKPLLHIRGTKSKAADRYVPIPPEVMEMIPARPEPFKKLCLTAAGQPFCQRSRQRAWSSLTRIMNIEMGCRVYRNELMPPFPLDDSLCPYCLRHTYCTNLQKRGVDIRTAQKLMGHSDIRMTANIYTHVMKEQIVDDYDKITGTKAESESALITAKVG